MKFMISQKPLWETLAQNQLYQSRKLVLGALQLPNFQSKGQVLNDWGKWGHFCNSKGILTERIGIPWLHNLILQDCLTICDRGSAVYP